MKTNISSKRIQVAKRHAEAVQFANLDMRALPNLFANAGAILGAQDRGSDNQPGVVCMANASRFTETYFSQPLTDYALGWGAANPELDLSLEHIAPMVQTPHRFEYAAGVNVEYFLSETDDVRAIGADFKRVEYTSTKVNSKTFNKGLTIRVDVEEVEGQPDWETRKVGMLMQRLKLNDFRRAVALLKAAATNAAVTWDATAGKDPDADALAALLLGKTAIGIDLNRAIYGYTAWQKRLLSLRAQSHAGGFANAAMTEDQLAAFLGLDAVRRSKEVVATGGAATTTKGAVFDTTAGTTGIVLYYLAVSGQSKDDPSNIKRFVSMTSGGGEYKVYRQEVNAKLIDITVEHYSNIVITSNLGIRQHTVS